MENFYNLTATEISSAIVAFNLLFSFFAALIIVWVYRRTHSGLSYSRSFLITLILVAVLGTSVMMVVRGNLIGAFAMLGVFSLIRFRTIVKDTKDVAFVFFSLVEGVAIGTNNYAVALLTLLFVSAVLLVIYRMRFGAEIKGGFIFMAQASEKFSQEKLAEVFDKYLLSKNLLHIKSFGQITEYSYAVIFKEDKDAADFIKEIKSLPGTQSVDLISGKESVEY